MSKKFKRSSVTLTLTGEEIEGFSEKMEEELTVIKMERQNRLRIRLSIEEALLNWRDHFGEQSKVKADFLTRMGRPSIILRLEGEACNPLGGNMKDADDWSGGLLTSAGLTPQYQYAGGENILKIILPSHQMNPALKMVLMILLGIALGYALDNFFQFDFSSLVEGYFSVPFYDTWNKLLLAISGPVILFMVMTTILNTDSITEQGGSSWKIVARYFLLSILAGVISMVLAQILFSPDFRGFATGEKEIETVLGSFGGLIPKTMLAPIVEANTPQIILLAFVLGNALVICGSRVDTLKALVRQINTIGMTLTVWMSRLVPYAAMILIAMQVFFRRTEILRGAWQVLVLSVFVAFLYAAGVLVYTAIKEKARMNKLLHEVLPPFLTSFKAGTLDASYGIAEKSCIKGLGIQKRFVEFGLPQGLVLYMPINVIGTIAFTIYAASVYDVQVSFLWLVTAVVLSVILFVATPPVPGANLIAYIVIFNQLKVPEEALVDAMIFDILFGILANSLNQLVLQFELLLQADKMGLVNRKRLEKAAVTEAAASNAK